MEVKEVKDDGSKMDQMNKGEDKQEIKRNKKKGRKPKVKVSEEEFCKEKEVAGKQEVKEGFSTDAEQIGKNVEKLGEKTKMSIALEKHWSSICKEVDARSMMVLLKTRISCICEIFISVKLFYLKFCKQEGSISRAYSHIFL